MKVFLAAVLVAVCGGILAEYILTDYAARPADETFTSHTARP